MSSVANADDAPDALEEDNALRTLEVDDAPSTFEAFDQSKPTPPLTSNGVNTPRKQGQECGC